MNRNPYIRPISAREWVFRHPRYVRYMAREFSCLFIAGWTALMVWGLKQLAEGPAAWAAFLELLRTPASIVFQLATLVFAAYHSITWFNLTPKALPLQVGESFVPGWVIAGAHFAGWAIVSALVLVLALQMAKSNKPIVWGPFAAGGTLTAFLTPILVLLTLLQPSGLSYASMHALASHWAGKVVLVVVIFLSLWSAAHRMRITAYDLGLRADALVAALVYLAAFGCTGAAIYYLLRI